MSKKNKSMDNLIDVEVRTDRLFSTNASKVAVCVIYVPRDERNESSRHCDTESISNGAGRWPVNPFSGNQSRYAARRARHSQRKRKNCTFKKKRKKRRSFKPTDIPFQGSDGHGRCIQRCRSAKTRPECETLFLFSCSDQPNLFIDICVGGGNSTALPFRSFFFRQRPRNSRDSTNGDKSRGKILNRIIRMEKAALPFANGQNLGKFGEGGMGVERKIEHFFHETSTKIDTQIVAAVSDSCWSMKCQWRHIGVISSCNMDSKTRRSRSISYLPRRSSAVLIVLIAALTSPATNSGRSDGRR